MADRGNWIQTYTGNKFYALDPRPEEVHIEDIAHSLSMMCRYAGHCEKFYSVAEHSVLVAENLPPELQLWGLLHDASEAYLVDIPRPFKSYLNNYYELENSIMNVVCDKFGLPHGMPDGVKFVDNSILADERSQNLKDNGVSAAEWGAGYPALGIKLKHWSPKEAEEQFLAFFDALIEREGIRDECA